MTENTTLNSELPVYFEWTIEKFSTYRNFPLYSSKFLFCNTKWWLEARHEGNIIGWLGLYLMKEKTAKEYHVHFKFGTKMITEELICKTFEDKKIFQMKTCGYGTHNFMRTSIMDSGVYICNDRLSVFCSAQIVDTTKSVSQISSLSGTCSLAKNFKDLYTTGRYTDVTFNVKSKEFHAHKAVLAVRSTVFFSMFQHDMEENLSGRVDILDCDPDTFERFLLFLYTGKLDNVSCSEAIDLYITADKYILKELKDQCLYFIRCQLTVDSFYEVIHLASVYSEIDLLKDATEFFITNVKSILRSTQWVHFLKENSLLCNDLLLKFVERFV